MKRLFLILFLQTSLWAQNQNILIVNDLEVYYGDTAWVDIDMNNDDEIVAFQFDLIYPDNLVYSGASFLSDRSNDHTLSVQFNVDYLRVMAYNVSLDPFSGNSGTIVTIGLVPMDEYDTFTIAITNPNLSNMYSENLVTGWVDGEVTVYDSHPYLSDFDPIVIAEDSMLFIGDSLLMGHIEDNNTPYDELIWSFTADHFTFLQNDEGFEATPEMDWYGSDSILIIVNDELFA